MTAATKSPRTPEKAKVAKQGEREIRIERTFNASLDRVWDAYTKPELLAQWWGRGNRLVVERYELERGGHWRFVEHSDHGVHGFEGRFREVKPMERLSMTFEWDGMPGYPVVSTAVFEDLGDGRTKLVARHGFAVSQGGKPVDIVRSGTITPTVGAAIGTTYLPRALALLSRQLGALEQYVAAPPPPPSPTRDAS